MTVREAIERLSELDPDEPIVVFSEDGPHEPDFEERGPLPGLGLGNHILIQDGRPV